MNSVDTRTLGIAFISIALGATGQFLFRVGMLRIGKVTMQSIWGQLFPIIFSPAILLGFFCFGLSSILWLIIISRWQLCFAYPFVALGYIIIIAYGTIFLRETLDLPRIIGSLLILFGISVLGLVGKN
jgi:multidrug transporter EmrE-like cation transporter